MNPLYPPILNPDSTDSLSLPPLLTLHWMIECLKEKTPVMKENKIMKKNKEDRNKAEEDQQKAPNFPVFTLKTKKGLVIAAGGGGNRDFGKKNGIFIVDDTTCRDIAYYETEDIILGIEVYEATSKEDAKYEEEKGLSFFLTCSGTNFFYFLKFEGNHQEETGRISLIKKVRLKVDFHKYQKDLFLISEGRLCQIRNLERNYEELDSTSLSSQGGSQGGNQGSNQESSQGSNQEGWESFFLYKEEVNKVGLEDGVYSFSFREKEYSYKYPVGNIQLLGDTLVFYLKGRDSSLHFIDSEEKIFRIKKITAMSINKEEGVVVLGTGDGKANLFKNSKSVGEMRVCDLPVTGIDYMNGFIYYSSFNGTVNRKKFKKEKRMFYILIFLLIIGGLVGLIIPYLVK